MHTPQLTGAIARFYTNQTAMGIRKEKARLSAASNGVSAVCAATFLVLRQVLRQKHWARIVSADGVATCSRVEV